jgi:hypothetical protein
MAGTTTGDRTGSRTARGGRRTGTVFWDFVPWIVFDVVAGPSTWKFAAFAALVCAVVLNLPEMRRGGPKVLDTVGIAFFAVVSVLGLALGRGDALWLETYAATIANGVVAVVALGSLLFTPFTEAYAKESAPQRVWGTPLFRHVNVVLTALWGGVFAVTAVLGLLAVHAAPGASDWLNWVIPIALLVGAVRITEWYPDHARARALGGSAPDRAAP